jgi:hypothetical protein
MENKKKLYDVEAKWTFKQIAYSLLQGNVIGYMENPKAWIADANDMTRKLLTACELFAREKDGQKTN